MKKSYVYTLSLFALFLLVQSAEAVTFKFTAENGRVLYEGTAEAHLSQSILKFTQQILKKGKKEGVILSYSDSAQGISEINGLKGDIDAIEVISDKVMRAYGWCYSLNGGLILKLASDTYFESQSAELHWFYAFAEYDEDHMPKWKSFCVPAEELPNFKI